MKEAIDREDGGGLKGHSPFLWNVAKLLGWRGTAILDNGDHGKIHLNDTARCVATKTVGSS